ADLARDLLLDRATRGDLLARLRAARDLTEAARLAAAAAARAGADLPGARAVGVLYARRAREDVEGVGRHRAVGERVAERAAAIAEHTPDEALAARPDRRDDARGGLGAPPRERRPPLGRGVRDRRGRRHGRLVDA